jgi:DNA-binding transcriptional ArsR family regulator
MAESRSRQHRSAADAFAVLGDETRTQIVRALGSAGERDPREVPYRPYDASGPRGLTYSELQQRAGLTDNGRLNYHLSKLTDHFVVKTDGRYRLSWLGHLAFRFAVAGLLTDAVSLSSFETDSPCGDCGAALEAHAPAGQLLFLDCPDCGARQMGTGLPPHAARSDRDILRVVDARERAHGSLFDDGVCPWCSGRVRAALHPRPHDDAGVRRTQPPVTYLCTDCGGVRFPNVGQAVATHPAVVGFLQRHTDGPRSRRLWEWPFVSSSDRASLTSTDPPRAEVRVAGDDGAVLRVTVGPDASVTSVEQSAERGRPSP